MRTLWNTILYRPLSNLLLVIISIVPGADVGLAIIILTILVKLLLFPLTQKSIEGQIALKELEPELQKIKESTTDKAEQTKMTMALYKERKVNPFSTCLPTLIQIPIIIALYFALRDFLSAGDLAYSFVEVPAELNTRFLGFIDLIKHNAEGEVVAAKNIFLAVLAGGLQYLVGHLAKGRQQKPPEGSTLSAQFAKSMQVQMLYAIPVITVYATYQFGAAIALYWITSNIVTILQELYTTRKMKKKSPQVKVL